MERQQKEAEDKFRAMEADMQKRQRELDESMEMIARLEAQLAETQVLLIIQSLVREDQYHVVTRHPR